MRRHAYSRQGRPDATNETTGAVETLLRDVPNWLELVLFTLVPALIAAAIHSQFRRIVRPSSLIAHHDVAGFLVAIVGVLYAVVLGFLVVNVWTAYDSAQRNADREAGDVGEVFALARNFREPAGSKIRRLMADYAFEVRDKEWPLLGRGSQDLRARNYMQEAFAAIALAPIAETELGPALNDATLRSAAFSDFHDLSVHRRQRLIDAQAHLPGTLYLALFVGGLIVFAFVLLFGVDELALQLIMTGLVIGTIGLLIGVIVAFDRPYGSGIRVSPDAFDLVIENNRLETFRDKTEPKP